MDHWADNVVPRVIRWAREDADYQEILRRVQMTEGQYQAIMRKLPANE